MRLVRLGIGIVLLSLVANIVAGCQPQSSAGTITDDLGRRVTIESVPQRIVSLAPSNTEILFALGLEDRVVGVTEFDNYPEAAKTKPKVGEFSIVDIEKVVSLQPELILAAEIHSGTVIPALEKLGLTVLALYPKTLDGVLADITLIGEVTGKEEEATRLVTGLAKRIKAITDRTSGLTDAERTRILYLTWHDPLWTAGSGTILDDLISQAGGKNIAYDLSGHKIIDLETVIQRNPQIIIVMTGHGEAEDLPYQYVLNEPRFKAITAVMTGRVYKIDADIFGRTTPRIVDGLEQLAGFIHPELFGAH